MALALLSISHCSSSSLFSSSKNPNKNPPIAALSLSNKTATHKSHLFIPQITTANIKLPRFPSLLTYSSSSSDPTLPDPDPNQSSDPNVTITDEWGEKAETEPEPEYLKASDSDPPRYEDEWEEKEREDEFVAVGNGSPTASRVSTAVKEKDERIEDLKRCLVDTVYGTDFGFRANPEIRAEVSELVNQLEATNPTQAPVKATALLDGNWFLV